MSTPDMEFVDSSNLEAIGYSDDDQTLWVQFKGGRTYIYDEVPRYVFEDLQAAPSKGSFLNREVKSNYHFRDA
jgi:hypothetical protein